jgi:hypothetical protein
MVVVWDPRFHQSLPIADQVFLCGLHECFADGGPNACTQVCSARQSLSALQIVSSSGTTDEKRLPPVQRLSGQAGPKNRQKPSVTRHVNLGI